MSTKLQITVAICAYNAAATIEQALTSVARQTLREIEILVIDDGSDDSTKDIVARFAREDTRVRLIGQSNHGIAFTRNLAFRTSRAPVVAFLDADDVWSKDHLAIHLDLLQHNDCTIVFGNARFMDMKGNVTGEISRTRPGQVNPREALRSNPCTTCSTMLILRQAFDTIGPFESGLNHAEDQEWLLRALLNGHKVICSSKLTTCYRTSTSGQSSDVLEMYNGFQAVLRTANTYAPEFLRRYRKEAEGHMLLYCSRRTIRLGQSRLLAWKFFWRSLARLPSLIPNARWQIFATLAVCILPKMGRYAVAMRSIQS